MSGLWHVKDLEQLEEGQAYELHLMKAGTYEKKGQERFTGRVEWVRTEPHHPEWGHVKLHDHEVPLRIDVNEWLEARKITAMDEMNAVTENAYDKSSTKGNGQLGVTMADLSERLEKEEMRAREVKKRGDKSDDDKEESYWEGYIVALRKAQELVKEYEIVKKWVG